MTGQDITIAVSILTVVSGGINVYVGLRLAALQAQIINAVSSACQRRKEAVIVRGIVASEIKDAHYSPSIVQRSS